MNEYVPISFGLPNKDLNWELSSWLSKKSITFHAILPEQQISIAELLDWDYLSTTELDPIVIIECAKYINWSIFIRNKKPKSVKALKVVKRYLYQNVNIFFEEDIKFQYYSTDFILTFPKLIDWSWAVKNISLDEIILDVFWHKFKFEDINNYQKITDFLLKKHVKDDDKNAACKNHLFREETINSLINVINWDVISRYQKLSEKFILEHKSFIDWRIISQYQSLSADFIFNNRYSLNMQKISQYQNLSFDFIKKHADIFNWHLLAKNKNIKGATVVSTNNMIIVISQNESDHLGFLAGESIAYKF